MTPAPDDYEWAWGVDVRTGMIAFGAVELDGPAVASWSIDTAREAKLRGAARLSAIRHRIENALPCAQPTCGAGYLHSPPPPSAIIVEDPTIVRRDFRLITLAGVVMEVLFTMYGCPVLEMGSSAWKKQYGFKGNASKEDVHDVARAIGWTGHGQDEADAVMMANVAALKLLGERR